MESISQTITAQRKTKHLSQEELAHQSGISLRTIQRIEKGTVNPHGHTLKTLASALELDLSKIESGHSENHEGKLRTLNIIGLLVIIAPLIHVFIQLIYWRRKKTNKKGNQVESRIISFQIMWLLTTLFTFVLIHIISYLIAGQSVIGHFPYRLTTYIFLLILNAAIVANTAIQLNKHQTKILSWVPPLL
ncbi:helix-turn-helix domain-containing protein [Ekhidna sp. To15]|uniref:helix-turn-helix domain-containing protein n=1 Tax=Ekhidna sp. To15 TaxID=3395267 RepID=UPI003F520416